MKMLRRKRGQIRVYNSATVGTQLHLLAMEVLTTLLGEHCRSISIKRAGRDGLHVRKEDG